MKANVFYVDDDKIIFNFSADRKILQRHVFTNKSDGVKKYTITVNYCSATKEYHVLAKLNDGVRIHTLWAWNVPYICNGQRYEFYYDLKKGIQPIIGVYDNDAAIETQKRNTTEISIADGHLKVTIFMSPKNAKHVYADIKKHHYVSPMYWDRWIDWFDCKCKACEGKEHHSWLSNPDIGYVRNPITGGNISFRTFIYRDSAYTPIDDNEYETLVFYNRDEYQRDVLDYYYPKIEYCKWFSKKELTVKIKNNPKWADEYVGTDTFDSLWNAQKMYRFANGDLRGKVYKEDEISEEDMKAIADGSMSERVVTLAYKQYEKAYMPFDELWKAPVSQEEIDGNTNAVGGAWRHKNNKKNILQKDDAYQFEKNDFEKVVTLSYHRTQVDDAIECPVCRDLYDIMRSGYEMVPWYKRLIVPYYKRKYRNK